MVNLYLYKRIETREGYTYEPITLERKSIEQLHIAESIKAGGIAFEVAFKEGYNHCIDEISKK